MMKARKFKRDQKFFNLRKLQQELSTDKKHQRDNNERES